MHLVVKCKKYQNGIVRKQQKKSKWKQKNTQFNYLHKLRVPSEVISPISLGMEPVRALSSNAFGDRMEEVSKWHCEKQQI